MQRSKTLKGLERSILLEKLEEKYGNSSSFQNKYLYWRKKTFWMFLVHGTKQIKRALDILLSSLALILLSPFILAIMLAIKLYDKGPILHSAQRVGKWGNEFSFHKFRTMKVGSEELKKDLVSQNHHLDDIKFKIKDDPRRTSIGKFLRKYSIDEIPQLWCVFKGDMTLVGPRPPLPEEVAKYSLEQRKRLDTTPGLTCIWQVSGRSDLSFEDQVSLDLQYIESQSLALDLKLIFRTIPAILSGKGAY